MNLKAIQHWRQTHSLEAAKNTSIATTLDVPEGAAQDLFDAQVPRQQHGRDERRFKQHCSAHDTISLRFSYAIAFAHIQRLCNEPIVCWFASPRPQTNAPAYVVRALGLRK